METDAAPGDTHPEGYGSPVFRLFGHRIHISDQNRGRQFFQDRVYSGRSDRAVLSGYDIRFEDNSAILQIPHMLGGQVHFQEGAAPVLGEWEAAVWRQAGAFVRVSPVLILFSNAGNSSSSLMVQP